MAYRIVKYIVCGEFWGDEHHYRPPQYKFWGTLLGGRVPPSPVIYAHADGTTENSTADNVRIECRRMIHGKRRFKYRKMQ